MKVEFIIEKAWRGATAYFTPVIEMLDGDAKGAKQEPLARVETGLVI